ncbi:Alpha-ketoglutarate-dependent dioxygenase abh1 [Tolypocladium paradoxum]|uniref:mRNA N(6)-methyladenine demethylase n=1 Tax=Tolypocladium paradoxum TaxID=94208 RepID=A0A2S4KUY2_9HYPO|nr:Alpha-ketoglutarate-dependent dioxygenase abh1 [Tolypocladium paradoxum]
MTVNLSELDAHEQPSDELRAEWKHFSRLKPQVLLQDSRIDDPRLAPEESGFHTAGAVAREQIAEAFSHLDPEYGTQAKDDAPILFHPLLPGLLIVPSLIPPSIQPVLLDRMLHRDLSNPDHQTNMHLHYTLPYPPSSQSLFTLSPDTPALFAPKDPSVHKPLSARQVLQRRLHWLTLGGQYDWTNRVYPPAQPPPFPPDLRAFLEALFPATRAQAAIVNIYSPGDTMAMHRDVSEETDKGLVSLSLGCDGLFMIAPSEGPAQKNGTRDDGEDGASREKKYLLLRLRSGDAVYMTQEARYAWHGVPKVLGGTCPAHLASWPATEGGRFGEWEGWMQNKRINLNVRQMRD